MEAFSLDEIDQHMRMLELSNAASKHSPFEFPDDSVCKACSQNRLTFEPPSLYCTCCGQRIKRNQVRGALPRFDAVSPARLPARLLRLRTTPLPSRCSAVNLPVQCAAAQLLRRTACGVRDLSQLVVHVHSYT